MAKNITVFNESESPVSCFISKYGGGDNSWTEILEHDAEKWGRVQWEVVVFSFDPKNINAARAGLYLNLAVPTRIRFHSLDYIDVQPVGE